jgi:hypothetical protein
MKGMMMYCYSNKRPISNLLELKDLDISHDGIFLHLEDNEGIQDDYIIPEIDQFVPESFDEYLLAQVVLPVGESCI